MRQTGPDARVHDANLIVRLVCLGALGSLALAVLAVPHLLSRPWTAPVPLALAAIGFVVAGAVSDTVRVPLMHGDESESLNFLEIVLVAALLILPGWTLVLAPLLGVAVSQLLQSLGPQKKLFNIASYTIGFCAAVVVYAAVLRDAEQFSLRGVMALILATLTFVSLNSALLAEVINASAGIPRRQVFSSIYGLSGLMAIGSMAVAAVAVAVAPIAPAIVPFTLMPALALWYAYHSAARQEVERERNACLITLSGILTADLPLDELLEAATTSIASAFGADEALILIEESMTQQCDYILTDAPTALPTHLLPSGWTSGVAVRLELRTGAPAALLVGSHASAASTFHLPEQDAPVLTTVAASLASAIGSIQHREALAAESSKLKAVVEHANDGIVVMADGGDVRLWSPAMARITGLPAALAQPGTAKSDPVLGPLQALTRRRGLTAVPSNDAETASLTITRPDGEIRDVSVSVVRARAFDNGESMSILTVHDVTAAARADRLKADFVATISHELRTPLTPIKGYAQLLRSKGDAMTPERRAAALDLIAERADHMGRLVEDLLMASRASGSLGSKLATTPSRHDMRDIVTGAVSSFPEMSDRLSVDLPDDAVAVFCDDVRAVQILSNLLSNAAKYSEPDQSILVQLCPTEFGDTHVRVRVVDHGFGIAADDRERVFQRFYRVEDAMTMRTSGSGLGLYIARELVAVMGGELVVDSTPGIGSTFTLTLPRSPAVTAEAALPAPRTA